MKDKLLRFIRSGPQRLGAAESSPSHALLAGKLMFWREGRVLSYKESFLLGAEPCKVERRKKTQRYDSTEYQGDCRLAH